MNTLDLDTITQADRLVHHLHRAHSLAITESPTAALLLLDLIGQARAIEQRLRLIYSALEEEERT